MKRTHESELEKCRVLIDGVNSNDAIKTRIAPLYPEAKLAEGPVLYNSAKEASNVQAKEKAEGMAAVRAFNVAKDNMHENFVRLRQSVRYFNKADVALQNKVYLNEDIPGGYSEWDNLVDRTLDAVLDTPALLEKLELLEMGATVLEGWKAELLTIKQLKNVALKEDGEAQMASDKKRETMADLKAYCKDLRECLNLFYYGSDRQALEQVGIVVK